MNKDISRDSKSKKITIIYPMVIGLILGFASPRRRATSSHHLSDVFFLIALTYMIAGLFQIVSNMGLFTSTKYSFRRVYSLISREDSPQTLVETYADYVDKQRKYSSWMSFLLLGFAMFCISVLISLVAPR